MLNSRRMSLATLMAIASISGLSAVAHEVPAQRGISKRKKRGRKYPEQSSRQALRGQRRAQGGPGIVLVGGVYEVRGVAA